MHLSSRQIADYQKKILSWYKDNKRKLPWREIQYDLKLKQRDPYKILVAEVMAQQTQLSRVIPKYVIWLMHFPTIESLAKAPTRDVLLHWSGLGYNNRALNLQKTAQNIVEHFKGKFPRSFDELIKLPGIGKYTANALLCFAFNKQVAIVDTNVRKVILLEVIKEREMKEKEFEEIAKQLLPTGRSYEWNQALMDYAAAVLKKEKVSIPKQSPFKTSNRFYRGETMKILVRKHTVSFADLWQYFQKVNPIEKSSLEKILEQMERDGFLKLRGKEIRIV